MDDIVNDIHNYCVNVKTREIYLNSYISSNEDDPGVDYRMSSQFIKNITHLDSINNKPILIHMHSIGEIGELAWLYTMLSQLVILT